jgi:hypothetical protein
MTGREKEVVRHLSEEDLERLLTETDTVVREYFCDRDTYFDVRGFENRVLNNHGGKESRTTV